MTTMDPYAQAAWDMELAKFRKGIGQIRPEDVNLLVSAAYRASQGLPPVSFHAGGVLPHIGPMVQPPPVASSHTWHQHWAYATPAQARSVLNMPLYFPRPTPWDRLRGRVIEWRKWLGSKVAGCECDTDEW